MGCEDCKESDINLCSKCKDKDCYMCSGSEYHTTAICRACWDFHKKNIEKFKSLPVICCQNTGDPNNCAGVPTTKGGNKMKTIELAREVIKEEFERSPDFKQGYLDNISIRVQDELDLTKQKADLIAANLLKLIFY